jgi:hypothetical protein
LVVLISLFSQGSLVCENLVFVLFKIKDEKDIGVLIDDELSFDKHICEMVSKANSIFAALRRTFRNLTTDIFLPLCKTLVRTHLDYAS